MVFGFTTPYVAAGAPTDQQAGTSTEIVQAGVSGEDVASISEDASAPETAWVQPALEQQFEQQDVTQVVVRLGTPDLRSSLGREATIQGLQSHAERTQEPILDWASERDGVAVENTFWLANAVVLSVRSSGDSSVTLDRLAQLDGVEELHANFEVSAPEPVDSQEVRSSSDHPATYGLNQINATEVWDQFGTMGEGTKVAILDTGVDPSHPDIDLYTENASDPTYPGGWAEFDGSGNQVPDSEPYDSDGHGTHTSGTATGGNASGEYIGVAPESNLIHGGVLTPEGGTFAAIIGGMEWAVQEDADVMSMSLGCTNAPCYEEGMIEPTLNAEAAGTVVVASSGNDGEGASSSPGNVWDAVAVGASNEGADIADFSSGMEVDTDSAWGDAAPSHWPDTYIVPDVSAPGVDVKSSVPGGGYAEYSGTSMSSPHTAGAVALMRSASGGDASVSMVKDALRETAWKPDGEPSGNDTRYGAGIINALEATQMVALEQGVEGTVTDADGNAIEDAEVNIAGGGSGTTNASGYYSIIAQNGTYDVTASAFGYESATETVTVDGDYVTQDFSLSPTLDVRLLSGQPSAIEAGENATAVAEAANLEAYTAELGDGYSEANATLYVNGQEVPWGQTVTFDEPTDVTATVTVETTADTSGTVSVIHTFEGLNDSIEVTTGPTDVFEEFTQVGVVDDGGDYGQAVKGTLQEYLPANYQVSVMTSDEAMNNVDTYDSFVVQNIDDSNGEAFASATSAVTTGVVWLDNWGSSSNGVPVRSSAIGDPANTDDAFGDGVVSYEVTSDHPIFEGVAEPGESVQLHTATLFNDHSWFTDTNAAVIGNLHTADAGVKGPGIAVDADRWGVMASTLGRETFVEDGDFTEEADQILANSVLFASDTPEPVGTVDVTETTVQPGEDATVTVWTGDIDNVSGYQAELNFDPTKLQVADINGVDFADPVTNIDNENGTISMAQAGAAGVDNPEMAEIEFDVLMDDFNQSAEVSWNVGGSMITHPNGTAPLVDWTGGMVQTADCTAGDVNSDGSITVQDATLTQQYIVGDDPANFNPSCADMNGDGQITSADVTLILEEIVGSSISAPQPMTASELVGLQAEA
ncbi:S8 family serine peptidase [Haloarchaeobius iranensis]|nr:S8 family serine peptidase [Haloarchaeobius iranensis]